FRSTWCRGEIGYCKAGRPSSAITWKGLRRLTCLWFRQLPPNNCSHFWLSGTSGATYYNDVRTHISLGKDAPCRRPIEGFRRFVAYPILGGLHHQSARI